MSDVVIKAEHLSKYYNLGVINNGTLFRDIQTWWALKRGKEDPHSQIGSHKYDTTKDGFWALKDLNFEIKQGDRVGIIGKNGAGKSTLLKILSRITAPTEGKVKIKGRVASLLEVGTGFHAELTGRENIYLNGAILGMKRREVDRKIDEIIAFSEIENHIDTPVKRYSSGMYVRLAFAVAAHLDSEILIADEVLAVGDAAFQKKALGKMNDLSTGEGRTVLFVSHNMSQVKKLCTTGILLSKGSIEDIGPITPISDKYLLSSHNFTNNQNWDFTQTDISTNQIKLNSFAIKNTSKKFTTDKDYYISFSFDSEITTDLYYDFLFVHNDIPLFSFSPFELDKKYKVKKGKNNISFKIPKDLMNNKAYTIQLRFDYKGKSIFLTDNPEIIIEYYMAKTINKRDLTGDGRYLYPITSFDLN